MNFDPSASPWNMPELEAYYGYPLALGFMALVALVAGRLLPLEEMALTSAWAGHRRLNSIRESVWLLPAFSDYMRRNIAP